VIHICEACVPLSTFNWVFELNLGMWTSSSTSNWLGIAFSFVEKITQHNMVILFKVV